MSEADLGLLQHSRWSAKPLTIITKHLILDITATLDPSLDALRRLSAEGMDQASNNKIGLFLD